MYRACEWKDQNLEKIRTSHFSDFKQWLRSLPPFTGVLRGPGRKVPHGVLFGQFLGTCLGVPQRVLFDCFFGVFWAQSAKKHSLGHSEAGAQNCPKRTPWGTFRPGPRSTPVNGGRDRNHTVNWNARILEVEGAYSKRIFQPALWLEKLLEGLLGSSGGFWRKFPEGGPDFLEVALVWKFPYRILPRQTS